MTQPHPDKAPRIIMLPSVSGGIGHISRVGALARALQRIDPRAEIEFVLDCDRLRPFNIDATMRMGFRPTLLPPRGRDNRDSIIRACLGGADVIVDDVARYLLPYRQIVPEAAWISVLMHPIGDELFLDWPFMAQMDALIWPYADLVGLPAELAPLQAKLHRTGPFLETAAVAAKPVARQELGLAAEDEIVVYAPRGFPFGPDFGHRVLSSTFEAVSRLRATRPNLKLHLLAVREEGELHAAGLPKTLPDWVAIEGVVTPARSLLYASAADVLLAEGTSTMHEGAALRTPLVLIPGPIQEATVLARRLAEHGAATLLPIDQVSADTMSAAFAAILDTDATLPDRLDRAHGLITGGGGAQAAAHLVLDLAARRPPQLQAAD